MSIPREISATRGAAVGLASIVGAAFLAYACHVSAAVTLVALGLHLSRTATALSSCSLLPSGSAFSHRR